MECKPRDVVRTSRTLDRVYRARYFFQDINNGNLTASSGSEGEKRVQQAAESFKKARDAWLWTKFALLEPVKAAEVFGHTVVEWSRKTD